MPDPKMPMVVLETVASSSWGCGACSKQCWQQWQWEASSDEWDISTKQLLPILLAVIVLGQYWVGRSVDCRCDKMAVVVMINAGRSQDTQ